MLGKLSIYNINVLHNVFRVYVNIFFGICNGKFIFLHGFYFSSSSSGLTARFYHLAAVFCLFVCLFLALQAYIASACMRTSQPTILQQSGFHAGGAWEPWEPPSNNSVSINFIIQ